MSTDTPLTTAPELPTTSHSSAEGVAWNAAFNVNNETNSTTATISSTEAAIINDKMIPTATTTTSTAYLLSGIFNTDTNNSSNKTAVGDKEDNKNQDSTYKCIICWDIAENAVVSMCGHLFCWPCLHQWLATNPSSKLCPLCRAAIDENKVVPLYGGNSTKQEDPRNKIPPRPAAQRTEPEPQTQPEQNDFQGFMFGSFRIPFGIECFILLCAYIIIITIYLIVSVTLRVFRPKYKDVLHSNKNPKIYTK